MSRKSGHFHSNLGCEAAGDSLPSNSCRFLPSPPPQLCYLLHAPAPTPSRTHPLRHSGFSLHLHPRAPALINCTWQGWKRESSITLASSVATQEDIICFLREHPLLGAGDRCSAPSAISEQRWAQRTVHGASPRTAGATAALQRIASSMSPSEGHSAVQASHFMDCTSCWQH